MYDLRENPPWHHGPRRPRVATLAIVLLSLLILAVQGRRAWCACGLPWPGTCDIWSRHCSQHLADPYSLAHVLHGLIFCGVLAWLFPRVPIGWRFFAATLIEISWELFENSDAVIRRYRATTISLDYAGDSVFNSLGDILSCALGFLIARRLGLWRSVVLFAMIEVVLLVWIRDSLLLNVVMLIHPIEAVKSWQMGHMAIAPGG